MNTYHDESRRVFQHTLGWLRQWACSPPSARHAHALGSAVSHRILSDSTIYMAYAIVAHLLQGGDMYGKSRPSVDLDAMTDDVWDAVFLGTESADSVKDLVDEMRAEFNPGTLRSARVRKGSIQNHLTFSIYNHMAIWEDDAVKYPRVPHGHLLLNGEKMSKSTGNFKTLGMAIEEHSADAMRSRRRRG